MTTLKTSVRKISIRTLIFLAYLFVGAGIFFGIEGNQSKDRYTDNYKDYTNEKEKFKKEHNITEKEYMAIERNVLFAVRSGIVGNSIESRWSFGNAFFFCGNVITTIGYGSLVPRTILGKLVMVLYALFGIPLTGFFLRTVGNELTNMIAYIVKIYERRMFNREAERLEIKCAVIAGFLACFMLLFGAGLFTASESIWDYMDGFYFCFVSLTTIGFGDLVPGQHTTNLYDTSDSERLAVEMALLIYYVLGLSIMSGVIVSISGVIEEKTKKLDMPDPMDAIRNLRIENLNSKAMKKLGYKVDEGIGPGGKQLPPTMRNGQLVKRRGTIIPDDAPPIFKTNGHLNTINESNNGVLKNRSSLLPATNPVSQLAVVDISPSPSPSKLASEVENDADSIVEETITDHRLQITDDNKEEVKIDLRIRTISVSEVDDNTSLPGDCCIDDISDNDSTVINSHVIDNMNDTPYSNLNHINSTLSKQRDRNNNANSTNYSNKNKNNIHDNNKDKLNNSNHPYDNKNDYIDGNHRNNNHSKIAQTDSSAYLIVDDSQQQDDRKYCYINGVRITAKNKLKTTDFELKNKGTGSTFFPSHHQSDNHTKQKTVEKIEKKNKRQKSENNQKRRGLPAELFANRVSITLNIPEDEPSESNSFYDIPITSPLPGYETGVPNHFFQNDECELSKSGTRSLDMTDLKRLKKKRRSSTGSI